MEGLNYFLPIIVAWLSALAIIGVVYLRPSLAPKLLLQAAEWGAVLVIVFVLWTLSGRSPP